MIGSDESEDRVIRVSVAQPILLEFLLWECLTMAAFNFNVTLHENIKDTTFSDWLFHEANNLSWQEIEEILLKGIGQ